MKLLFTAAYNINGTAKTEQMTYDTVDVIKTLERRLKTAFPNATGISITLNNEQQGELPLANTPITPKGVK